MIQTGCVILGKGKRRLVLGELVHTADPEQVRVGMEEGPMCCVTVGVSRKAGVGLVQGKSEKYVEHYQIVGSLQYQARDSQLSLDLMKSKS